MARPADIAAVVAERLRSQLLAGRRPRDPLAAVRRILAVQGQDPRGARLALRARSRGLTAADVDRALSDERSLVITWLNRGTLHLVASEDYHWLHRLTTPPLARGIARRLAQEGVSEAAAERGVSTIARALAQEGPLGRRALRAHLQTAGVRTAGQALVHVLALASMRGLIVRGPMREGEHAYVLVADWLGDVPPVARERGLAELARRYLAGHAPASDRDLARWSGLPLRDARAGLCEIAGELRERPDGLLEPARARTGAALPPPLLLGAFDPVLLGWSSREELLRRHAPVIAANGVLRPFALVRGVAAATWTISGGQVALAPFARIRGEDAHALEVEAGDVLRFMGLQAG